MNESLALRIAAIFEIFLASIAGICFPFIANSENADSPMFRCLKAGSAGVMLGLAVVTDRYIQHCVIVLQTSIL
jgi:hypothetical protein